MLPRKHRLPLRTELNQVKKEGKIIQGRLFSLLAARRIADKSQPSRFGFIISTKIHKRAVKRNRAKRLLSEVIHQLSPEINSGFDVVFLAKRGVVGADLNEIKKEVKRLFIKARIIVR